MWFRLAVGSLHKLWCRIDSVPVDLSCQHHCGGEHRKNQYRSCQLRIILHAQYHKQNPIQACQGTSKQQRRAPATHHVLYVKAIEQTTPCAGNTISLSKRQMLTERKQQKIKNHQRSTDKNVLDRMDRQALQSLKK